MNELHKKVLGFFSPTDTSLTPPRSFPPAPAPLAKRECRQQDGTIVTSIEQQKECIFLSKFPPEIRNVVYEYVDWGEELAKPEAPKSFDDMFGIQVGEESGKDGDEDDERNDDDEDMYEEDFYEEQNLARQRSNSHRSSPSLPTHPQPQSLPAKSIQQIAKARTTPHPLALLLTCRQINLEATIIAYNKHTFTTSPTHNILHQLQHSTSLLSTAQLNAISSLAYQFPQPDSFNQTLDPTPFIANALVHFPGLKRITVIMQRLSEAMLPNETVQRAVRLVRDDDDQGEASGICHIPTWWAAALEKVLLDSAVRWQTGEKWSLHWTQDESFNTLQAWKTMDENNNKSKSKNNSTPPNKTHITTRDWLHRRSRELCIEPPYRRGIVSCRRRHASSRAPPRRTPRVYTDLVYASTVVRRECIVGMGAELVQDGGRRVAVEVEFWEYARVGRELWAGGK